MRSRARTTPACRAWRPLTGFCWAYPRPLAAVRKQSNSVTPSLVPHEVANMKSLSVAAVVVTYNRRSCLERCIDTLLHQTRPLDAVYVIDNASTDETSEYLAELASPVVRVQRLP